MTHPLKKLLVEMVVRKLSLIRTAEAGFKRESVYDAHLSPDGHALGALLSLLNQKATVRKVEYITIFVHEARKDALLEPVVDTACISIHKDVFLPGVPVQVTNEKDVPIFLQLANQGLEVPNRRV